MLHTHLQVHEVLREVRGGLFKMCLIAKSMEINSRYSGTKAAITVTVKGLVGTI